MAVSHPGWMTPRVGIVYAAGRPKDAVPYLTKDTTYVFRVYDVCATGLELDDMARIRSVVTRPAEQVFCHDRRHCGH